MEAAMLGAEAPAGASYPAPQMVAARQVMQVFPLGNLIRTRLHDTEVEGPSIKKKKKTPTRLPSIKLMVGNPIIHS